MRKLVVRKVKAPKRKTIGKKREVGRRGGGGILRGVWRRLKVQFTREFGGRHLKKGKKKSRAVLPKRKKKPKKRK